MELKYNIEIKNIAVENNLKRITNQIYKLLPNREEGVDWQTPLSTIMEELSGMNSLIQVEQELFLTILSKLEGLFYLTEEGDFFSYRRTIFEVLGLMNNVMKNVSTR